jgi:hypothetical protein
MDHGTENLDLMKDLLKTHHIRQTFIFPYHPQANGLVEHRYYTNVNFLAKCDKKHWIRYLPLALRERTVIKESKSGEPETRNNGINTRMNKDLKRNHVLE